MKFGIGFATSGKFSDPGLLAHLATTAECCGFESLWSVEHVAVPVKHLPYPGSKDGSMPGGDDVATVDVLSGGRVILGIGSGWMKEEFEALGIDFHRRGAMTDEAIQALRALWKDGAASFEGKHFKFGPLHSNPKSVARNVPIHVGGHSTAAARRAGRYGDGFFPTVMNPEKLKELFATVRSEAQRAGRNPDAIEFSCLTRSLKPDDLKILADMGVSRVVVNPPGTKPEVVTRGLEKFREEVMSRV